LLSEPLESRRLLHAEGVLSGTVFFDANADGTRDFAESGVPGVVLQLSTSDATVNRSTITDDNGNYTFGELEPGTYTVAKRAMHAVSTVGASNDAVLASLVLEDDQILSGNLFPEQSLRPEFFSIGWFFASSPPQPELVREAMALGEELAGDASLAASIRASGDVPVDLNNSPIADDDVFAVDQDQVLVINAQSGVLANDDDSDGQTLTATLLVQADNGVVSLSGDGSFTYTPDTGFNGTDSFTYQASDGLASSNTATVTITVNPLVNGNRAPVATNDSYTAEENQPLVVDATLGVLNNDTDADDDLLSAAIESQPTNGTVSLNPNGSFTYQPDDEFFGDDSFTYRVSDGPAISNLATVSIDVRPVDDGTPFAAVTVGSFTDPGLLGVRTDLIAGAPAITADHVNGDVDYSNYSNPPTYGNHHPSDSLGTDSNPGITPRPTGIYTSEQPDEDLIHNLEHGHVWISYNPSLISSADVGALRQLIRDGAGNGTGEGVGVLLTPRAANDNAIELASWARLLTLDGYDPDAIRDFVNTNRGKAPEGFITP
jgi:VCBS repeat-containing protein